MVEEQYQFFSLVQVVFERTLVIILVEKTRFSGHESRAMTSFNATQSK